MLVIKTGALNVRSSNLFFLELISNVELSLLETLIALINWINLPLHIAITWKLSNGSSNCWWFLYGVAVFLSPKMTPDGQNSP